MKLLFATQNEHKFKEVSQIFGPHHALSHLPVYQMIGELPETHETIEENAKEKALFVFENFNVNCFWVWQDVFH